MNQEPRTMMISPELAAKMIAAQAPNRNKSVKKVDQYRREMDKGRWGAHVLFPIVLSKEGRVLDGQHRLDAVIKHGKPVEFCVVVADQRQVDLASENRPRTIADRLRIFDGLTQDVNSTVSAMRLARQRMMYGLVSMKSDAYGCSTDDVRETIARFTDRGVDIQELVSQSRSIYTKQPRSSRVFPPAHIIYALLDASASTQTYERMISHLHALCEDSWEGRTKGQNAVRHRLLDRPRELRLVPLYGIMRSFNEPTMTRLQLVSRYGSIYIPDAIGGFFEQFDEDPRRSEPESRPTSRKRGTQAMEFA